MSDTPETQKLFDWFYSRNADRVSSFIGINRVQARVEDMERERNEARLQVKLLRVENNHNWQANDLAEQAFRERNEANAQMCQAIGHLSDIAQTCQEWLDSIIQEPAVDFIKAIRDWAKKKASGENK
jgi:hypothetical protein